METVLLVVHMILALAIIGLVLIQRSEGGGLGIGGGGGGLGNFATPRATANALTRATALCAAAFFVTSLILGIMAGGHTRSKGILDTYGIGTEGPAAAGVDTQKIQSPSVSGSATAPAAPQTAPDTQGKTLPSAPAQPAQGKASEKPATPPAAPISE